MNYINRAQEMLLKNMSLQSKVVLITGSRQVGKSTVINHIFKNFNSVSLDNPTTRLRIKEDPEMFFMNNPCPLFIDEIQKEPILLEYIKEIVDKTDDSAQFILSGSQNLLLMKDVSESLAGRVLISELNGLSLREINNIKFNNHFVPNNIYIEDRENHLKKYENLWMTIHTGSYPKLYKDKTDWQSYYSSYVKTYLERDINEYISSDEITFMKFLTSVAARTGQILDYTNIANNVEVDSKTIKSWISMLERTGIIFLLQPYSSSTLTRTIKRPKIYFRDTGLACYLTKWYSPDTLMNGAVAGNMFETFVVSEILKSYTNEGLDYKFNIFYYRGKDKLKNSENEIDLIIEENGTLYPIEIKLTASPKAIMASANTILDKIPDKKRGTGAIVCLIDKKTYLRENLIALPIEYI